MPTQFIDKKTNVNQILDLPNAAGVAVVNGVLFVHNGAAPQAVGGLRSGVAVVTGTLVVATGLSVVTSVGVSAQDNLDGDTLAGVSATIVGQAAGSVLLKAWKVTAGGAAGNPTLIAATVPKSLTWWAVGS